ncbi:DUF6029 family protein [Chitinophaga nivalis]|uniref:DUF6029 family protein n=1 Tax=Chitinophaga nivalis TaxID=2991709 RepID=A0ABT3IGF2_9BACT|nr:DUF6029 family protein [Chitinophaga nivalis]MCW3467286.1 DUF6029 family protein [Chitinophaga nivalis]MCW3483022.1 DUF6029 family protein [Chitinophaga nivalis]
MNKRLLTILALTGSSITLHAQEIPGKLSGGLESNHQYYVTDNATDAKAPTDKIGSNSYFTLNYTLKNFYAGIQLESYLPALVGYPDGLKGTKLTHRFAGYRTDKIDITAGNFYEQYGNGLVFRSFEERQLGIDNIMDGVNVHFTPLSSIRFKASYGLQRVLMENGEGTVRGADLELDLLDLLKVRRKWGVTIGGSIVNRFQQYTGATDDFPTAVNAYSARLGLDNAHYRLQVEYAGKSADPNLINKDIYKKGSALYIGQSITTNKGLGIDLAFRRLENMDFRSDRSKKDNIATLNYLPALTKLYTYSLPNLYPYAAQTMGEIGGKADIYYTFRKHTPLGGRYGTRLSLTASLYRDLDTFRVKSKEGYTSSFWRFGPTELYRDVNITMEKRWTPMVKTIFSYMNLLYNKGYLLGPGYGMVHANAAIADVLLNFDKKHALRVEAQHLWTPDDEKNWAALLLEYSCVPGWSFFAGDMLNYQTKSIHYYNIGGAYAYKAARISLSYGRQREGLLCVGGICRIVPAYTGASLSFTYNF